MARVSVAPEAFHNVLFDGGRIAAITSDLADRLGLPPDLAIHVEVDETTPFGLVSLRLERGAVVVFAESGAFEDPKRPRELSEDGTRLVLARLLFRVRDRLDPAFGDPPPDEALTWEQHTAWDAYSLGRFEALGYDGGQVRRRYHFRLRHGFTDVADRVFDRLWGSDRLTWGDLEAACAETAGARPAAAV